MKTIICFMIMMCCSSGYAQLYIDPGHGGPGADQYHNGGDGSGAVGQNGTAEQWVNLNVAMAIRDTLLERGCVENVDFMLSRLWDTTDINLQERIFQANNWGGWGASEFISVHHNGLTPSSTQGTEVVWCDRPTFDNGDPRPTGAYQDTLARKVRYKLLDKFGYQDRCFVQSPSNPMYAPSCMNCSKYIARQAAMANVISEASDISYHADEEELFTNPLSGHTEAEASAILQGWDSFYWGQGFGRLEYTYLDPRELTFDPCTVYVDYQPFEVPYERCWNLGEEHTIEATNMFEADGYWFTFHHWAEVWYTTGQVLEEFFSNPLYLFTPGSMDGYHYYVAYFSGGPFSSRFVSPDSSETEIQNNQVYEISWNASEGAGNTCSLYVDYSTNGGGSWTPIAGPIPYNNGDNKDRYGSLDWNVPDISSSNCYLRIIASDVVDHIDTLISHQFGIDCYTPQAEFEASILSGEIPLTVNFTDYSNHDPTSWQWDFGDGGTSNQQDPTHVYGTSGVYTVTLTAGNNCGTDDTVMTDLINASCEIVAGFTANVTTGQPPLQVIFYDRSDPNYCGNYYLWDFGDGTTSNDLQITSHWYEDYGTYSVSLTVGLPCGAFDDTVMVDYINIPCCDLRGDADNDGAVDVSDVIYTISYLYGSPQGPEPPCQEEGDANADGSVNVSDVIYTISYLYGSPQGPAPPPC
ncbi:MAG: PKD domain-containing protein [candidate division Zixibacteria bacterium]|nr:PKD domain-containing protein [candidate division Zixibacteria bacterium]